MQPTLQQDIIDKHTVFEKKNIDFTRIFSCNRAATAADYD
jgi:hypothetical protein